MPKYKSLLSKKSTGGSVSSGGKTKSKSKKGSAVESGGAVFVAGSIPSACSVSSGGKVKKVKIHSEKFDKGWNIPLELIKLEPHLLVHLLEGLDEKAFNLIHEIASQRVGHQNPYHPKYVEKLKKSHELYAPNNDIHKNCKSLHHLKRALCEELKQNPRGGGLFGSIWSGLKSAGNFIKNKVIDKIPDAINDVQKFSNKVIKIARPIASGIADVGTLFGVPEAQLLPGMLDTAHEFVNNPLVEKAQDISQQVKGITDKMYGAVSAPQQKMPDNVVENVDYSIKDNPDAY